MRDDSAIVLWKQEGETPLACIERARREGKIAPDEKATYAGRLDPMASGVLLVLTGDDVYRKDDYLKLPKEYVVEVLFGISTDTGDILGRGKETMLGREMSREEIVKALETTVGTFEEAYPLYSSKPVDGKPLFMYAKEEEDVTLPLHTVTIHSTILENMRTVPLVDGAREANARIEKVEGDFRQEEIVKEWKELGEEYADQNVTIATIRVSCESGAYMRTLAEKIGEKRGIPALAWKIVRTKLGEYTAPVQEEGN